MKCDFGAAAIVRLGLRFPSRQLRYLLLLSGVDQSQASPGAKSCHGLRGRRRGTPTSVVFFSYSALRSVAVKNLKTVKYYGIDLISQSGEPAEEDEALASQRFVQQV